MTATTDLKDSYVPELIFSDLGDCMCPWDDCPFLDEGHDGTFYTHRCKKFNNVDLFFWNGPIRCDECVDMFVKEEDINEFYERP